MLFSDCHQIQCYVDLVRSSKKIVESYLVLISKPRVSGVVGVIRGVRGDQGWLGFSGVIGVSWGLENLVGVTGGGGGGGCGVVQATPARPRPHPGHPAHPKEGSYCTLDPKFFFGPFHSLFRPDLGILSFAE